MKGIILTMNENKKYQIIKSLVNNNGNKITAQVKLGVSRRTIDRYIKNYKLFGKISFRHKNHDIKPKHTIPLSIINKIINLYSSKYNGFNFKHFNEFLKSNEGIFISYNALYNILSNNGFISPKARKITKRNHHSSINTSSNTIINDSIHNNNEINIFDSHPRLERSKYFGECIQMDASNHIWFGKHKAHLHLAIDDASSRILGAFFDTQETLFGYYNVLFQILTNYGIPYMFLTDNRTIFNYHSLNSKSLDKDTFTQFSFACSLIGTDIDTTSIPQSKGKVERSFNTHQDRLISELSLMNITTIEEANLFLNSYIKKHNQLFSLPLDDIKSVFEIQPSLQEINCILATRYERVIDNGHSIKFKHKYYQPFNDALLVALKPKTKCMVIEAFDGCLYLESGDMIYHLNEVKKHKEVSKNIDLDCVNDTINNHIHSPLPNHPWRNTMIKKHQYKLREQVKTLEDFFDDCTLQESI